MSKRREYEGRTEKSIECEGRHCEKMGGGREGERIDVSTSNPITYIYPIIHGFLC